MPDFDDFDHPAHYYCCGRLDALGSNGAARLEPQATAPLVAVSALRKDPCKFRLYRAGCAVRYGASIADEPLKTEAPWQPRVATEECS